MLPLFRYQLMSRGWITTWVSLAIAVTLSAASIAEAQPPDPVGVFNRIATFFAFENTNDNRESVAEIVDVSEDGNLLVYTDSATRNIGFVDITDPSNPTAVRIRAAGGEPTSVAVAGQYALVAVNTGRGFVNTRGRLKVYDLNTITQRRVADIPLAGQPDSVAVSPDNAYAAVVIENERNEDLNDGALPQLPAGFLVIVDLQGLPGNWTTRTVDLTGLADLFPDDPEPEFVAINSDNIAAVSLQENNHIVLVNLVDGSIVNDWNAGTVNLIKVDVVENDLIELDGSLTGVPREPDALTWISPERLATADEGDLNGGSRGFTIFNPDGVALFTSRNTLEHRAVLLGHYPEHRSENKGNEPEGIATGIYGDTQYLFVGSEGSSVVFVYQVNPVAQSINFVQVLPTGVGPEGLLAIPERNLFVVASEEDSREDKIRSSISIYERHEGPITYPTIVSNDRPEITPGRPAQLPIPWASLSALAADRMSPTIAYTAYDDTYRQSRILTLTLSPTIARIDGEIVLRDASGETLDLDIEGLATRVGGGFWVVSEGAGSVGDLDNPVTSSNVLLSVADDGAVLSQVELPPDVNARQRSFGFAGVASVGSGDDELVYVAFQREWARDPNNRVRIGRYEPASDEWTFFHYPLDLPESPNGGWVGLSGMVAIDETTFAVVERDNQAGPDATVKRIYSFSVGGIDPQPQGRRFPLLAKTFVRDLLPDLESSNGPVLEKVEGLMITLDGTAWIVTDNMGTNDSSGETQMLSLGNIVN